MRWQLPVRQRTQFINALCGHFAEYGWVAPRGVAQVAMLADLLEEEEMASSLPEAARAMLAVMTDMLAVLTTELPAWTRRSPSVPARMRSRAG